MSWPVVRFEELYAEPSRNGVYKPKQFHGAGVKIVNMGELFAYDIIANQEMNRLAMTDSEMARSALADGDLLFGRRSLVEAGAGKCSLVGGLSEPVTFESSLIRIRIVKERIRPRFLFYWFKSLQGRGAIGAIVTGTNVKGIRAGVLKNINVVCPPIALQDQIVETLKAYDDLIENNRRRIQLLEQAARLLYREWFVHLHFPGHKHAKIKDGVLDGWTIKSLGDLTAKIGSGATPRGGATSYKTEGVTLIRSLNVYDYRFDDNGLVFIDDGQAKKLSNVIVEPYDILLNITGASVARCCMVPERHLPARVNQHVMIVRADPANIGAHYLLCAINSEHRKQLILNIARAGGATREALTKDVVSGLKIPIPKRNILDMFEEVAGDLFKQMQVLEHQSSRLAKARDLILPHLMNGEISV